MAYEKQSFLDGTVLSAEQLDHMEEGIFNADQTANQKATINDITVGPDAWSSKQIIDRLCPAFTKSGPAVTCEPVEGYPLAVMSFIDPVRETGSLITEGAAGHTTAKLTRCGKNLFDGYWEAGYVDANTGKNTAHSNSIRTGYIPLKPGVTYYFTLKSGGNYYPVTYDKNKTFVRYMGLKAASFVFTAGENEQYLRLAQYNDPNVYEKVQLEVGSAGTAYEPYRGEEFTVDLGQTVCGGSYNWRTGVLTVTHGEDGTELETPATVQLTPGKIPALSGENTLYSDTGDTTVTGKADPTSVIKRLTNAIIALGGNI